MRLTRALPVLVFIPIALALAGCGPQSVPPPSIRVIPDTATPTPTITPLAGPGSAGAVPHTVDEDADATAASQLRTENYLLHDVVDTAATMAPSRLRFYRNGLGDPSRIEEQIEAAFSRADALFTPATEPPSIGAWGRTPLPVDVLRWYDARQKPAAERAVRADLAALDGYATDIAAGK